MITFIDILGSVAVIFMLYLAYCGTANHLATSKIDQHIEEIEDLVYPYSFCSFSGYDRAPCEVTYGLSCEVEGSIPSRRMLRLLRRIKSGSYKLDDLYALCMKRQRLSNKRATKPL